MPLLPVSTKQVSFTPQESITRILGNFEGKKYEYLVVSKDKGNDGQIHITTTNSWLWSFLKQLFTSCKTGAEAYKEVSKVLRKSLGELRYKAAGLDAQAAKDEQSLRLKIVKCFPNFNAGVEN